MGYAFISYSSENQASADAMRELFKKHNIDTWMAPYDIPAGSSYMGEINRALISCDCLVLMLSEAAQNSQWVLKELERAVSYKKTIIPIKIEDIVLNDDFDFVLGSCHVVAVRKIDENSEEVKNVLKSVVACTKEKINHNSEIINAVYSIDMKGKEIGALLNESQGKDLMSCKCRYCGMHAEVISETDGYYTKCVHCGAVGTIAETVDLAIKNWKLCMGDGESPINKENLKLNFLVGDSVEKFDADDAQYIFASNPVDMNDIECLPNESNMEQEDKDENINSAHLALSLQDIIATKDFKQYFSNPVKLCMPNNEVFKFDIIEKSSLDDKYTIVLRKKTSNGVVFTVFKNPKDEKNIPVAIFEGKKLKKIYRAFMEKHKNEYIFTDEIDMQPNIQSRKTEQPRVFTQMTASGMFGPYLKDIIEIPAIYTFIDGHVFEYANKSYSPKKISKLIIPNSVTKIEDFAFADIVVNEIEIPDSVIDIGYSAFKLAAEGFVVCNANSYAYRYAKHNDLKNSVDIVNNYKINGVCAHCGGKFSGLLKKKCILCGKEKDY